MDVRLQDTLPPHLDLDTEGSLILSWFKSTWGPPEGCVIAALPFSWFCLQKLHGHERMLNQTLGTDVWEMSLRKEADLVRAGPKTNTPRWANDVSPDRSCLNMTS